jgi:hypothetical protein
MDHEQGQDSNDPEKFDANAWVAVAKNAGMKYIVITSKHHDGFAMFDSKVSDWNIVKATPFHRDPLKELAAACRKAHIKLGFYYSQAQDWNNGGAASGGKWDPAQTRNMDDYIDKIAVPQVREILSNYGEFPAVLWWDTPHRNARAENSGQRLPGPGLGNVHDAERHVGLQTRRQSLEIPGNDLAQPNRHRQQRRQLPPECGSDLRRADSRAEH